MDPFGGLGRGSKGLRQGLMGGIWQWTFPSVGFCSSTVEHLALKGRKSRGEALKAKQLAICTTHKEST